MKLHDIAIKPSRFFLWLDVESRTTWRTSGSHLWNVPAADNFDAIQEWNRERPPAALCGYRPRRRTMRLNTHSWAFRCIECRTEERACGIMGTTYHQARQRLE